MDRYEEIYTRMGRLALWAQLKSFKNALDAAEERRRILNVEIVEIEGVLKRHGEIADEKGIAEKGENDVRVHQDPDRREHAGDIHP